MNGEIEERSFDEVARTDPRPIIAHVRNALNELDFATFKTSDPVAAVLLVNAMEILEGWLRIYQTNV